MGTCYGFELYQLPSPAIETDVTTTYTLTAKNVDGCEDQFDLLVEVTEVFIDAGADILECTRVDSLQIGNSNPQPGRTYSWSPTTGLDDPTAARPYLTLETDSLTPLEIVYTLTITDESLGCTISDEMTVSLVGHPSVSILGEEPTIIRGTGANLVANGIDNAGSYLWSPPTGLSNTNGEVVTARPDTTQLYIVEGRDEYGCKTEAEIVVNVIDPPRINVPTAFTPNGDGIHDFFRPVSKDIELQTFQVFNRWGEMVYDDISDTGWDGSYNGEIQGLGVYVYFIQYRFIAGDKIEQLQGSVTLIR